MSVLFAVRPIALVYRPVGEVVDPLTVTFSIRPLALVLVAVSQSLVPLSVVVAVRPLSLVECAVVWVGLLALSGLLTCQPAPGVDYSRLEEVGTLAFSFLEKALHVTFVPAVFVLFDVDLLLLF